MSGQLGFSVPTGPYPCPPTLQSPRRCAPGVEGLGLLVQPLPGVCVRLGVEQMAPQKNGCVLDPLL